MARRTLIGGVVMVCAAALLACSGPSKTTSSSTAPAALPARGVELAASEIPWKQVGPGWILATWSAAPGLNPGQTPPSGQPAVAPVTLFLLDPVGGRFKVTTFALSPPTGPGDLGHTPFLADWSGDGRHALFEDFGAGGSGPGSTAITDVDLTTGTKHTFTVDTEGVGAGYSLPAGQAILLSTFNGSTRGWSLDRVDLSGNKQLTYPTDRLGTAGKYNGTYVESPDGTQVVLGTTTGMVVIGNDGVIGKRLLVPGTLTDCSPVRWWTSGVLLARCAGSSASQLWRVPLDGGAPSAVTAVNTGQEDSGFGPDLGDTNAWQLPSGTFLQSEGGCGSMFLSRLTPDLRTTKVTVPGVDPDNSVLVSGVSADKLVLRATVGCGSGISALTYDPAANTTSVLLGPPVNGGGVQNAILYGRKGS
ncbi:MAG TPA: hypothetical protein VH496_18260 [Mycobacterium sp.]|jgi:TolB protein